MRVGGEVGYQPLQDYIRSNDRYFMRQLLSRMHESDLSYSQVVDQMILAKSNANTTQNSKVYIQESLSGPPSPLRDEN